MVLSSGNFGLLSQYKIDWTKTKPLSRVIEGVKVVRTFLDDGAITFDGEFFQYEGLFTFARPVQERVPVKMGAMRGPKSFVASAEHSDGCHHALSYTREAYDYAAEHLKIGAEKAGKDWTTLDFGAWVVVAVGRDSAAAKDAARSMVGIYASSMPAEQLERNGVDPDELKPIIEAIGAGDLAARHRAHHARDRREALLRRHPRGGDVAKIKEIEPAGVNHLIAAITDRSIVKTFTGREIPGVGSVNEQLQLHPRRGDARLRLTTTHDRACCSSARPTSVRVLRDSPCRVNRPHARRSRSRARSPSEPRWTGAEEPTAVLVARPGVKPLRWPGLLPTEPVS